MADISMMGVAKALSATAAQAWDELNAYHFVAPMPQAPAVMVVPEFRFNELSTMDRQRHGLWRMWVLVSAVDVDDQAELLYQLIDTHGDRSIPEAMRSANAAWRNTGISSVEWLGFARMPTDIQGPNHLSWGGPEYYVAPLLFQVRYDPLQS